MKAELLQLKHHISIPHLKDYYDPQQAIQNIEKDSGQQQLELRHKTSRQGNSAQQIKDFIKILALNAHTCSSRC